MIEVVPYDPDWPGVFAGLRRRYAEALLAEGVRFVAIEHVGSTAVPGLAAKPVIDCDIVLEQRDVDPASRALAGLGFVARGDLGIPLRWAFREPDGFPRTNTYVVVRDSLALRNHLAVRDVLRADPALREEYATVKMRVGATAADLDEYGQGKSATIQKVLAAAGLGDAERASIAAENVPSHGVPPR